LPLNQPIWLDSRFENLGPTAAGRFAITYYLSEDTKYDPGVDPAVGSCWMQALMAGGRGGCEVQSAVIPETLRTEAAPVDYHWLACADRMDLILEADETNGCIHTEHTVAVPEPAALLANAASVGVLAVLAILRWWRAAEKRQGAMCCRSQPP
jgi:hypothetical protein